MFIFSKKVNFLITNILIQIRISKHNAKYWRVTNTSFLLSWQRWETNTCTGHWLTQITLPCNCVSTSPFKFVTHDYNSHKLTTKSHICITITCTWQGSQCNFMPANKPQWGECFPHIKVSLMLQSLQRQCNIRLAILTGDRLWAAERLPTKWLQVGRWCPAF
jgi:hypothetical protein